jgi:hypothetical protein
MEDDPLTREVRIHGCSLVQQYDSNQLYVRRLVRQSQLRTPLQQACQVSIDQNFTYMQCHRGAALGGRDIDTAIAHEVTQRHHSGSRSAAGEMQSFLKGVLQPLTARANHVAGVQQSHAAGPPPAAQVLQSQTAGPPPAAMVQQSQTAGPPPAAGVQQSPNAGAQPAAGAREATTAGGGTAAGGKQPPLEGVKQAHPEGVQPGSKPHHQGCDAPLVLDSEVQQEQPAGVQPTSLSESDLRMVSEDVSRNQAVLLPVHACTPLLPPRGSQCCLVLLLSQYVVGACLQMLEPNPFDSCMPMLVNATYIIPRLSNT